MVVLLRKIYYGKIKVITFSINIGTQELDTGGSFGYTSVIECFLFLTKKTKHRICLAKSEKKTTPTGMLIYKPFINVVMVI